MIKHTLEISREPAHLAVKFDQLAIQRPDGDPRQARTIPCEDIGVVMVDNPAVTYSHAALVRLMDFGAAMVICGRNHLPVGMLLPLASHTQVVWRIRDQLAVSKPLRKQLWRQVVVAKILAQARNLEPGSSARCRLLGLARQVRSGDPSNIEAQAARAYWPAWLPEAQSFRRNPDAPDGDAINAMLNYGYAVLRAAVARALVAAGLHPVLGLHHANRSDAFCLADDLVEPLRPLADARVRTLYREGRRELDQPTKAVILDVLAAPVRVADQTGPLMVGLHRSVASLVDCYQAKEKKLLLPVAVGDDSC